MGLPITAIIAQAPPGGCTVFVISIAAMAKHNANAQLTHVGMPIYPQIIRTVTPVKEQTMYPPTTLRGCARGD
jgi:hypothetical protein